LNKNSALIELAESDRTKFGKEDFAVQTFPQKVFSAIWAAESEINNGGFVQFFQNTSNETSPFVVEAFHVIGAPRTADICQRAIAVGFPGGLPPSPDAISAAASDFTEDKLEQLAALDEEFFQYPHNLTELLFAFVLEHPLEFGPMPNPDAV
jgi:hypothetical protein